LERLVTTTQAAQILGLSLQGIHYRIKKNQLKSIKKSGKIFVYISDKMENDSNLERTQTNANIESNSKNIESIIEVKNEQIVLLKKSLKWTKKQYSSEINRLEKNQKSIIGVFKSEIQLLQRAFNEMRSIYKPQLENYKENISTNNKLISLQEFTLLMKKYNKSQEEIKSIILLAIKNGDKRFIYNKTDKKLIILSSDFKDLL
jgi:hypothetical protein